MKEPKIKDFNLTKEELELYEKQKKDFIEKQKENNYRNNQIDQEISNCTSKGMTAWIISGAICFIFGMLSLEDMPEDNWFIAIIIIGLPILIGWITYKISLENVPSKRILYEDQYIDKELAQKVNAYNDAVSEYNAYLSKIEELKLKKTRDFWTNLTGFQFEQEVCSLFNSLGIQSYCTPATGDGGIDIVIRHKGYHIAVQCKHYNKPISPAPVRQLRGVLDDYDGGIFVSLCGYTSACKDENINKKGKSKISLLELRHIVYLCTIAQKIELENLKVDEPLKLIFDHINDL